MNKNQNSSLSSLFSTVKKLKHNNQLQHAKSYDDIFSCQYLDPSQVKILLNNGKSLKNLVISTQTQRKKQKIDFNQQKTFRYQEQYASKCKQDKQELSQILQQSIKKQNILIKKQLFDPFKYFGSGSQVISIHQSSRHHQSRLQAMFSENNSPIGTEHSSLYRKKSPINKKKKVAIDVHRISNSILISKLEKLQEHENKIKQKCSTKQKLKQQKLNQTKHRLTKQNKQNIVYNNGAMIQNTTNYKAESNSNNNPSLIKLQQQNQSHLKITKTQKNSNFDFKKPFQQPSVSHYHHPIKSNYNIHFSKNTQQNSHAQSMNYMNYNCQSLILSSKKNSIQNYPRNNKTRIVNCSPKNYVKQTKQTYLKMNLNNMQKVRLKLKLNSASNIS